MTHFKTKYEREIEDFSNFPDINDTRDWKTLTILHIALMVGIIGTTIFSAFN